MPRPRHQNKEIESAVKYAESKGWRYIRQASHAWGVFHCPEQSRAGHQISVLSTPRNTQGHAEKIRRMVDACTHTGES